MIKKGIRIIFVFLILFSFGTVSSLASGFVGEGTAVSPFLIETREDLLRFRDAVNNGNSFAGVYFLQTADIDLSGIEWIPIGIYESGNYFCGTYDGGGYSISHLTIHDRQQVNPGFFGMLGGTVMNLSLLDGTIESDQCVGAFASHASSADATIINCYSDMQIKGRRAGGIVDNFAGNVYNCVSVSDLVGSGGSGGIYSYDARIVENCFSSTHPKKGFVKESDSKRDQGIESYSAVASSLNQWLVEYADSHADLRRDMVIWNADDGQLGLSKERHLVDRNFDLLFFQQILNNVNEIGIMIAVLIAIIGAAVLLAEYIWSARIKNAVVLGLACLGVFIVWFGYSFIVPLARGNMEQRIIEQVIYCSSLIGVFFLVHLLLDRRMLELCNRKKRSVSNSTLKTSIFIGLFVLIQMAAFLVMMNRHMQGRATASVFFQDRNDSFMDLFHSICTSRSELGYMDGAIYPPLCYIIYKVLGRFVPYDIYAQENAAFLIRDTQEGMVVLLLFLLGAILFVFLTIFYAKKGKDWQRVALAACLMVSAPFLFALERANLILYVLGFMLIFIFQYRSENRFTRELALASLAIATALKLTPGILMLLLLLEKDYKALVRTILYAGALLLFPFSVFGGYDQIPVLLGNLLGRSQGEYIVNLIAKYNTVGIGSVYTFIGEMISHDASNVSFFQAAGLLTSLLVLVSAVLSTGRRRVLALIVFLCGFSHSNCPYTMIYMFIPLIMFLDDDTTCTRADATMLFLFLAMFAVYPIIELGAIGELKLWSYDSFQHQTLTVLMQGIALVVIAWLQIAQTGIEVYRKQVLRKGK